MVLATPCSHTRARRTPRRCVRRANMPKNIAPAANSAGVADHADVFSHIYTTPPEAFGLRRSQKPRFVWFLNKTFVRVACTARTSLDIPMNMHGTWPQCAGTMSGRASCVHRGVVVHLKKVVLTLYPHYGLAFVSKNCENGRYGARKQFKMHPGTF